MSLPSIDWGKLITNTIPGLLLALTVYMLVDVFSEKDITARAVGGDPSVLSASIASLAAFSTFLGVFLDALGHSVFELNVRTRLQSFQTLTENREQMLMARGRPAAAFSGIYRVMVDSGVRESAIESHYRFTEFTVNGALAMIPFGIVFPVYAARVLAVGYPSPLLLLLSMAAIAGAMAWVAVQNVFGWEQVKDGLVFGTTDKP